ncbi:DUF2637 domain-containing protein [Streptomyces sp. enrichment culture]|uniref:DUF2637 domain-containing protein n=1 Tax=Streptomyces sp. enrichment culture TaxID=1795815 RepID=UPI003F5571B5
MKRLTARHWLAVGAAAFTVALTAVAFWLSYEHLHDVAAANGLGASGSTARAWAWPATVDMFIIVGELLILRASLRGTVDPWAIALTALGSLGSIALNVAGVGTDADPLEYIVAGVPPIAALLAFGALMRQVHEVIAGQSEYEAETEYETPTESVPVPDTDPADPSTAYPDPIDEHVLAPVPERPVLVLTKKVKPVLAEMTAPRTRRVSAPVPDRDDVLVKRARRDFEGRVPTFKELKEKYGIGQARAGRIRAELEGVPA